MDLEDDDKEQGETFEVEETSDVVDTEDGGALVTMEEESEHLAKASSTQT